MNSHELKQKQTRLTKLEAEISEENESVRDAQKALARKQQLAQTLREQITEYIESQKDPIVSEHALLRYFERVAEFDLDAVKDAILTDEVKALIAKLGNGTYPVNGFKIKVKNKVVVTII